MKTKVCTKCSEEKPLSEFYKGKEKCGYRQPCRLCQCSFMASYYKKNREKKLKKSKIYYKNNKEKCKKLSRRWEKNNPEKHRRSSREDWRKASENLSDMYVKHLFCENTMLLAEDIPEYLVALKRVELKFKRYMKDLENGKTGQKYEEFGRESRRCAG